MAVQLAAQLVLTPALRAEDLAEGLGSTLPAYAFLNESLAYARNFCKPVASGAGGCLRTSLWMAFSLRSDAKILLPSLHLINMFLSDLM